MNNDRHKALDFSAEEFIVVIPSSSDCGFTRGTQSGFVGR
jgi:hypothetical protein